MLSTIAKETLKKRRTYKMSVTDDKARDPLCFVGHCMFCLGQFETGSGRKSGQDLLRQVVVPSSITSFKHLWPYLEGLEWDKDDKDLKDYMFQSRNGRGSLTKKKIPSMCGSCYDIVKTLDQLHGDYVKVKTKIHGKVTQMKGIVLGADHNGKGQRFEKMLRQSDSGLKCISSTLEFLKGFRQKIRQVPVSETESTLEPVDNVKSIRPVTRGKGRQKTETISEKSLDTPLLRLDVFTENKRQHVQTRKSLSTKCSPKCELSQVQRTTDAGAQVRRNHKDGYELSDDENQIPLSKIFDVWGEPRITLAKNWNLKSVSIPKEQPKPLQVYPGKKPTQPATSTQPTNCDISNTNDHLQIKNTPINISSMHQTTPKNDTCLSLNGSTTKRLSTQPKQIEKFSLKKHVKKKSFSKCYKDVTSCLKWKPHKKITHNRLSCNNNILSKCKQFMTRTILHKHEFLCKKRPLTMTNFSCYICSRMFPARAYLRLHKKSHFTPQKNNKL